MGAGFCTDCYAHGSSGSVRHDGIGHSGPLRPFPLPNSVGYVLTPNTWGICRRVGTPHSVAFGDSSPPKFGGEQSDALGARRLGSEPVEEPMRAERAENRSALPQI